MGTIQARVAALDSRGRRAGVYTVSRTFSLMLATEYYKLLGKSACQLVPECAPTVDDGHTCSIAPYIVACRLTQLTRWELLQKILVGMARCAVH